MLEKFLFIVKKPIIYVLFFCILVQIIVFSQMPKYITCPDTTSYIEYYGGSLINGKLDSFRTPVYPYFIKAISNIFGADNLYIKIANVQSIIFCISILLFYLTLNKICKKKVWTCLGTIAYGACPYIFSWNRLILTESLAISLIVLLSYLTVSYLKSPKKSLAIIISSTIFIMIMLRPAFLYLLLIYVIFWIIRFLNYKKDKKCNFIGLISIIVCVLLILTYCGMMKFQHGRFALSEVGDVNTVAIAIRTNSYKLADNKEIVDMIDKELLGKDINNDFFPSTFKVVNNYNPNEISQFLKSINKNDDFHSLKLFVKNAIGIGDYKVGVRYIDYNNYGLKEQILILYEKYILPFNFGSIYIILAIVVIYILFLLFKYKRIPYILAFFVSIISGNLFTILIASPGEFARLFCTSLPLVVMLISYILSNIHENINIKKFNDSNI